MTPRQFAIEIPGLTDRDEFRKVRDRAAVMVQREFSVW